MAFEQDSPVERVINKDHTSYDWCVCGSNVFQGHVHSGYRRVVLDQDGTICNTALDVYNTGCLYCTACHRPMTHQGNVVQHSNTSGAALGELYLGLYDADIEFTEELFREYFYLSGAIVANSKVKATHHDLLAVISELEHCDYIMGHITK